MSDFDDQFEQSNTPEVVNTPVVVDSHREHVCEHITASLTKHLEAIANKKYDTKVTVSSAGPDKPMTLDVRIQTNDPRVIAALAAGA